MAAEMETAAGRPIPWPLWPFVGLWRLLAGVLHLTGRVVGAVLGLVLMIVGIVLSLTIVGAPIGVPVFALGFLLTLRSLF